MTINDVISETDNILVNDMSYDRKVNIINEMENKIYGEFLKYYFKLDIKDIESGYGDTDIIVEKQYYRLYIMYLLASIELFSGNIDSYNSYTKAYNDELKSYIRYIVRNYRKKY